MKRLGFVREMEPRRGLDLPPVAALAGRLEPKDIPWVLAYLEHGTDVFDVMEATRDPEEPGGRLIPGGSSLVTDGEWVWRKDLPNFIRAHRIVLPEEFLSQARVACDTGDFPRVVVDDALVRSVLAAAGWV